jgi:hypothetical protein
MSDNRADQFKADMADMKLKTGGASKDAPLQLLGVLLMVAGIVVAFGSYMSSTGQKVEADIFELFILGLGGVALTIAGAAIYLRCALAKFLRVWLLRQIMENRTQAEDLAERLTGRR